MDPPSRRRLRTCRSALCTLAPSAQPRQQHHNGAPVDGERAWRSREPLDAEAAAAHNRLHLRPHASTSLMDAPFDWARDGAPRDHGLRRVTPEMAAQFDRDGFLLFEGAFRAAELAPLVAEIDRLEEELSAKAGGISTRDEITFCAHLVLKSELCRQFTAQPLFADLCYDLLNVDTARLYWDQSVYKKPCPGKIFPFHQDNGYTFIEPQPYLTCWVALNDATTDNGCPNVIPAVHRQGARLHEFDEHHNGWTIDNLAPDNAVPVPARAGDIVVFSSLAPHMTGPNTTDGVRKAYICQYAPDGVVQVSSSDGTLGGKVTQPANEPSRQYMVMRDGEYVQPPPMP